MEDSGKNEEIIYGQNAFKPEEPHALGREDYLGALERRSVVKPQYTIPEDVEGETMRTTEALKANIYGDLVRDTIQGGDIQMLRREFQALDDRERLNPQNVMLRVIFMHAFSDTEQHKYEKF